MNLSPHSLFSSLANDTRLRGLMLLLRYPVTAHWGGQDPAAETNV